MKVSGSLQVKKGYYYAVLRIETLEGDTKQVWKSTKIPTMGKSKRETDTNLKKANKFLQALVLEYENQPLHSDKLFSVWIDEWLEKKKHDVELVTWEAYESYSRVHIKPYFAKKNLTIDQVTPKMLDDYIAKKQGENLSNNSIRKHFKVFRGVFKRAYKLGAISNNPCDRVDLPKKEKHKGHAYTPELCKKLLVSIENDPIRPAIMLALYLGLRRSEVMGLRWSDVDLDNDEITISNTVVRMRTQVEKERTKTEASNDVMDISPELKAYLVELKAQQEQNRAVCGKAYGDTDGEVVHVCVWPDGRPLHPDFVSRHFGLILKKNGLPKITFHELRHTCASLLINGGANAKQVQEYLRHEDVRTTLSIYSHLTRAKKAESAKLIDGLLQL